MIGLAVAGCLGKMGRCVLELAAADERFEIVAALRRTAEGNIETSQRRNVETSERRNVETSRCGRTPRKHPRFDVFPF